MRKGWKVEKLDDVCQIEMGKTPPRGNRKYWDVDKVTTNVWLSIADLNNTEGKIVSDSKEYISNEGAKLCKTVKKGTLLVSFKLTLGRLAFAGIDLHTNEAIAALSIKDEKKLPKEFLYWYLSFFDWDAATGGDVKVKGKTLNKEKLKQIEIPIPPLPEQQRIVSVLDEAFTSIAQAKSNAERNLVNARELFESVSGKLFIAYSDGWIIKKIGDVCSLYQGLAINQKSKHLLVPESNLPLLRIKDLRNNSAELYVKESGYPKNSLVTETDILYSRTGASLGMVFTGRRGILHNNSFKIAPNSMLDREYLFWWLQNPVFKKKIFGLASKTAQPDITHEIFKQQEIMIPPLAEQRAIVGRLEALSAETGRLEEIYQSKVDALEELKKSVLQKAFSGEL